jgi:hypothetical protein
MLALEPTVPAIPYPVRLRSSTTNEMDVRFPERQMHCGSLGVAADYVVLSGSAPLRKRMHWRAASAHRPLKPVSSFLGLDLKATVKEERSAAVSKSTNAPTEAPDGNCQRYSLSRESLTAMPRRSLCAGGRAAVPNLRHD